MNRTILHVDMDAFYASVEEREDPSLRGRPVVVGSDPRKGRGRGVVAACNYEARRFGLHSAMPISRAWQRCPHAAYVRPRFVLYSEVSKKIFAILGRYTDLLEPISIDEAFLDVTGSRKLFGDGPTIARRIKAEIRDEESLAASIGVAGSKFIAKLASDLEKPDGLVVVPPGEEREFLGPLDVRRLWGAGPKTVARLHALGAHTIGGVARLGRKRLIEKLGDVYGARLFALSQGLDERPVNPHQGRKSLSKESTFNEDVADRDVIERTLLRLCVGVASALRRKEMAGRTVTLKLRWESFETLTRQTTLLDPVDTTDVLWPVALELFRGADQPAQRVRLIGIGVSGFDERGANQLSLFEADGPRVDQRVASALDRVTERFGNKAVMRAALLGDVRAPRSPTEATEASEKTESAETTETAD